MAGPANKLRGFSARDLGKKGGGSGNCEKGDSGSLSPKCFVRKWNCKGTMGVPVLRTAKAYEKYAWIIFAILPVFHLGFGLVLIFAPAVFFDTFLEPTAPGLKVTSLLTPWSVNHAGAHLGSVLVGWFIMLEAVTWFGYRKGEKWAWYALCYVPILLVYDASLHFPILSDMAIPILFLGLAIFGLMLPFRKFFPGK
ncbi:MAG: hypothetical protein AUF79_04930 [Crenarchaeota archaeon 13_1_20CM_2_51_8]|nr:MAG: hypothetical protein AUF79_04930 [Crenarchaeota archaeon 13_1_20CM_2_51_8]